MKKLGIALLTLALVGCASGPQRPRTPDKIINRALSGAPGQAQPSTIVATELAFARMAREEGQWKAFAKYAADGGLIFGSNGAVEAKPFVSTLDEPAQAVQWEPHQIWISCDGSLAATTGSFQAGDGEVGRFNTVWQRQRSGDYKYLFDFGFAQTPAPQAPDIIGSSIGKCGVPAEWRSTLPADTRYSADGSLAWRFELVGEGTRTYQVWLAEEEGYARVVDIAQPPAGE